MATLRLPQCAPRVRVGAADASLTGVSGMVAVSELLARLNVVRELDRAVGRVKARDRGPSAGQVLVGIAAAQLAGEDFLVGLDRHRADVAGQALTPVPGLAATTAAGVARRCSDEQWLAVETGIAVVHERMLGMLPEQRVDALCAEATIDLDTTDVEVYGRQKRGVAYNHQGQRVGRPHVAVWAEPICALAADLMSGRQDPRSSAAGLLRRAHGALPARVRAGKVRMRADAGYFAGELALAAHALGVGFAIGAKRMANLWRLLDGIVTEAWTPAIDMPAAEVAVSGYRPKNWPPGTRLLIRRVRLTPDQISVDPRSRRRRTLHPDQRALPFEDLAGADAIYGYSFILTDLDVSTPELAAQVEGWYRHRTIIENVFRDAKHGAGLRHLPSGYEQVNRAWMWGALIAASTAGWLHQLTGVLGEHGRLSGWGTRGGQAMIATLRQRLICVPARLIHHARALTLRLPPGRDGLLPVVLARIRALPAAAG